MPKTRYNIILVARTWLGTKYKHQGRLKGIGADCVGFVGGVMQELGYKINDNYNYTKQPDGLLFQEKMREHFDFIYFKDLKEGDVLSFSFNANPQHIAIVTQVNPIYIIHSVITARKVVEHVLDDEWKKRISGSFRFKELEE